ncbi:hypothetical protein HYX18_04375 [Candidatus Woesearchaeota archaeon]|nr:hypothetical protein [Candidatus Woesearchaeota archaeon]
MGKVEDIYMNHYKKLLLLPLLLLVISLSVLSINYFKTNSFIKKDVSLEGGISITINSEKKFDIEQIKQKLEKEFPQSDISIRELADFSTGKNLGIVIDMSDVKADQVTEKLSETIGIKFTNENFSVEEIGSSLGASFFKQMVIAVIFSLLLMAIAVAIMFKKLIPSVAVISSIVLELIVTLAVLSIIDFRISPAGIAALLMVMGYSIDTDILLTTRVLKRETGTVFERIKGATKTGLTMTMTTIAVSILMLLTTSSVLKQIFTIILIALIVDIITTWVMNASLLIWYLARKQKT